MFGKDENTHFRFAYCFLPGFLAGIFLVNFGRRLFPEMDFGLTAEVLSSVGDADIDRAALFAWCFGRRMREAVLLAVFSTTWLGTAACAAAALWYGAGFGILLASCVAGFGFRGVLIALGCVFPQYAVYGPALLALWCWCGENCRGIYGARPSFAGMKTPALFGRVLKLLWILLLLTAGCALEACVSPGILKGLL